MDVVLKRVPRYVVAYTRHVGLYVALLERCKWLADWLRRRDVEPVGPAMGIHLDDVARIPARPLRSEALVPIEKPVPTEGGVRVKTLPEGRVAATIHRGALPTLPATYAKILRWTAEHGYALEGTPREIYLEDPQIVGRDVFLLVEIQVPVRRRQGGTATRRPRRRGEGPICLAVVGVPRTPGRPYWSRARFIVKRLREDRSNTSLSPGRRVWRKGATR